MNKKIIVQCNCGNYFEIWNTHFYGRESGKKCNDCKGRHLESKSRLYDIWINMKSRCNNKKSASYVHYGKKNILICEEWEKYTNFKKWALSNGYKQNLTIDRIDNNKDYCPENCKWSTYYEQNRNKTNSIIITYKNKTQCLKDWCRELEISYKNSKRDMLNKKMNPHEFIEFWYIERKIKILGEKTND